MKTKIFALVLIVLLIFVLFLLASKKIDVFIFWIIVIAVAIIAYKIMPRLKQKKK